MRKACAIGWCCVSLTGCAWSPKPYTRDPVISSSWQPRPQSQLDPLAWPAAPALPIPAPLVADVSENK